MVHFRNIWGSYSCSSGVLKGKIYPTNISSFENCYQPSLLPTSCIHHMNFELREKLATLVGVFFVLSSVKSRSIPRLTVGYRPKGLNLVVEKRMNSAE